MAVCKVIKLGPDGAAAALIAARWRAVRVAGKAAAGRRLPARDEILHELAALEETEAEAEEEAAVEAEQRRHRQGVEAEEAVAEVEAQRRCRRSAGARRWQRRGAAWSSGGRRRRR